METCLHMQDTPLHLSSTDCTIPAVYSEQITKADDTQLLSLQSDALLDAGVDEERMYEDCASGRHDYRPGLEICLKALRRGNTFVIW